MDEKKNTYNVVGLGEILWDLLPEGKQLSPGMKELDAKADAVCLGSLAQRSEVTRKTMEVKRELLS